MLLYKKTTKLKAGAPQAYVRSYFQNFPVKIFRRLWAKVVFRQAAFFYTSRDKKKLKEFFLRF